MTVGAIAGVASGELVVEERPPPGQTIAQSALQHACSYTDPVYGSSEVADPAIRLAQFANAFPNSAAYSICNDIEPALADLAARIKVNAGNGCLPTPIDRPEHCDVFDVSNGVETRVEAMFVVDSACTLGAHQRVIVDRHGTTPPIGTMIRVRCSTAP